MKELPSEEYRKKGVKHLGEKLKQRVEGMVSCAPFQITIYRSLTMN